MIIKQKTEGNSSRMERKKRNIFIVAVVICIAAVICAAAAVRYFKNPLEAGTSDSSGSEKRSDLSEETEKSESSSAETDALSFSELPESSPESSFSEESESEPVSASENTVPANQYTNPAESLAPSSAGNVSAGNSLPYAIPDTGLVVRQFSSYDGIFLEDGKDAAITGVTVMVLTNTGASGVEYASVTVERDGEILHFQASAIPGGATIVVQEAEQTPYRQGTYTNCKADAAVLDKFEMSEDAVRVEEAEDHSLIVTNLTGETIPAVRIFYKFYMEEENAYVGGITYNAKITDLAAGESRNVTPSHYAKGFSRIVMVRTYETAD